MRKRSLVVQGVPKFLIFLPLHPECWNSRFMPPYPVRTVDSEEAPAAALCPVAQTPIVVDRVLECSARGSVRRAGYALQARAGSLYSLLPPYFTPRLALTAGSSKAPFSVSDPCLHPGLGPGSHLSRSLTLSHTPEKGITHPVSLTAPASSSRNLVKTPCENTGQRPALHPSTKLHSSPIWLCSQYQSFRLRQPLVNSVPLR